MEQEKKLYPLRFCALEDKYSWGSEEFKLADLGYRDSLIHDGWLAGNSIGEVMDMYMDRVVGENVFEFWGRQFPVTVKLINVKGKMPLRVHPTDEFAAERYDFLGKEKLWYILRAGKDASLMLGFRKDTNASELYSACADNSVESLLNVVAPHAGQCFRIAPGVVHAAGGELQILEISESSPLDFCLCSWGQELSEDEFDPALSPEDALEFVSYGKFQADAPAKGSTIVDIPQFKAELIKLDNVLRVKGENFDSFTVYVCLKGAANVRLEILGQSVDYGLNAGEAILIPAECEDFVLMPMEKGAELLDVTVPPHTEKDPYINPAAAPTLEEQ